MFTIFKSDDLHDIKDIALIEPKQMSGGCAVFTE